MTAACVSSLLVDLQMRELRMDRRFAKLAQDVVDESAGQRKRRNAERNRGQRQPRAQPLSQDVSQCELEHGLSGFGAMRRRPKAATLSTPDIRWQSPSRSPPARIRLLQANW